MSLVQGEKNVQFLKTVFEALSKNPLFPRNGVFRFS
ncbi:hypothetical protein ACT7C1_06635 [Bacillus paranthracis]